MKAASLQRHCRRRCRIVDGGFNSTPPPLPSVFFYIYVILTLYKYIFETLLHQLKTRMPNVQQQFTFFGGRMGVSLRDVNEASEGAVCLKALAYLHFLLIG